MRRASSIRIPFALRDGHVVDIAAVERGLACGCACPSCSQLLVARKGPKVAHHFAHHHAECTHGLETRLHQVAKVLLDGAREIWIPPLRLRSTESPTGWRTVPGHFIAIDEVRLERRLGDIVPDVVVRSATRHLLVEITVTHPVSDEKCRKARRLGYSLLEIDLSDLPRVATLDYVKARVLGISDCKRWKVNLYQEAMLRSGGVGEGDAPPRRMSSHNQGRRFDIVQHGFALHVMGCPIAARVWHGQPYANVIDDCSSCEYLVGHDGDAITCRGAIAREPWEQRCLWARD